MNCKLTILPMVLVLVGVGVTTVHAQSEVLPRNHEQPDAVQLENVHIQAQSVELFFSELSLSHNVPIGLEIAYDVEVKFDIP